MNQAAASAAEDPRIAAALARNDRYNREFIEAFNLCPYAKRTRESGRLHRAVLLEEDALGALSSAIEEVEALPVPSVDVALLILPGFTGGAAAFEQLVSAARERMQQRHPNGDTPFYCVPFHPEFAEDLADEHRAVRFIRRSPDPTVQLVRASLLHEVRGSGLIDYVNTAGLSATELMAITSPMPVSDRIAQANLRTLQEAPPDRVRALLSKLRCA